MPDHHCLELTVQDVTKWDQGGEAQGSEQSEVIFTLHISNCSLTQDMTMTDGPLFPMLFQSHKGGCFSASAWVT